MRAAFRAPGPGRYFVGVYQPTPDAASAAARLAAARAAAAAQPDGTASVAAAAALPQTPLPFALRATFTPGDATPVTG